MKYLKKDNLKTLVEKGIHVVDFYTEWCGPCRMMESIIEKFDESVEIIRVDADKFEKLCFEYRIMSVPTLIFFKDGEPVFECIGFTPYDKLMEVLKKIEK